MTAAPYFLPPGYESRLEPEYFVDAELNAVWQPDLYPEAAAVARRLDSHRIVDVGCGTASKLAELHPEFEVVGIDFGSNIAVCRDRYDFGTWIDTDLDASDDLGFDDVAGAVLICGDVIEHLVHPERMLQMLRHALDAGAAALLLSTPERELTNGAADLGPPLNKAHVREWTLAELEEFLASEGLVGFFGLTRSNDVMPYMRTSMAAIPGDAPESKEVVQAWFEERRRWQDLAVEQDKLIHELEGWTREVTVARDWAEEERKKWQARAEAAEDRLAEPPLVVVEERPEQALGPVAATPRPGSFARRLSEKAAKRRR